MLKLADKFQKEIINQHLYIMIEHQYGGSECGMYSMYFILKD